jgi:segregation and condensation protein B
MSEESTDVTVDAAPVAEATTEAEERFIKSVQALLFASPEPVPAATLCATNGQSGWGLDRAVDAINDRLETGDHPMRVRQVAGGFQMYLLPEFAPIVEAHLVKTRTHRLSRAGLETLAIVAYRQPCTTPQLEHVRGVACDGVIRTLLERNLITIKGRSDAPGRPLLYATTVEFLRYFGLDSIDELPGEDQLEELMNARIPEKRDPLVAISGDSSARPQDDLFGRITLKRGPESGEIPADGRFVVSGVCSQADETGWETVAADDQVHIVITDVEEESTTSSEEDISDTATEAIDAVEESDDNADDSDTADDKDSEKDLLTELNTAAQNMT